MGMTFKSLKDTHIVTVNGKPRVFATLIEALRYIWGVKK